MPGNPIPTASSFAPFATAFTCSAIACAMSSAGMESSASCVASVFGNDCTPPSTWLFSTNPVAMCCTTWTPASLPIPRLPFPAKAPCSPLDVRKLVQSIKRRRLITFRQRRIIENRLHKIFDRALQHQHRLPDVQQFRRALSDNVYAQQQFRFRAEDQFQPPRRVASNLSSRNLAEIRNPNFIRYTRVRQLVFRLPDK